MPLADLLACIKRFCAPDPRSRSQAEEGRKLVPIDPARDWGWRVVNIQLYRDRASGRDQIKDGRNAEKVRRYKERHRTPADTGGHRETPPNTDSYSYSYSYSNTDSNKKNTPDRRTACAVEPAEFVEIRRQYPKRAGGQRWGDALRSFKRRVSEGESPKTILDGVLRYAFFVQATGIERTERVQQAATFLGENRGYLEQWQAPPRPKTAVELARENLRRGRDDGRVVSEQSAEGEGGMGSATRLLRG